MLKTVYSNPKVSFLVLTILAGLIMGWPHVHFQSILSQGDIGRDLYVFEQVWKGKLLYKDMWWVYGPLMPYYYGLFYLLVGFKISSILLGKLFIEVACGVFFYLAASLSLRAFWAFLAAVYFMQLQQDFFFTYNHVGGIALTLAAFWLILEYLHKSDIRLAMRAVVCCFLVGLVKINFGMSALAATVVSIALIDWTNPAKNKQLLRPETKGFYLAAFAIVPILWICIYAFFIAGMPIHELRQCFPYFGDDEPFHQTLFETIPYFIQQHYLTFYNHLLNFKNVLANISANPSVFFTPVGFFMTTIVSLTMLTHPILHVSTISVLFLAFSKKFSSQRKMFWLTQAVVWTFFILNFHEFFNSGRWYRTFWSQPFLLFFSFTMIATAMSFVPTWLRRSVAGVWILYFILLNFVSYASTQSASKPDHFLKTARGQIYIADNGPDWIETVDTVTAYLNDNLKKEELFFALPYDCLYYYLTGKPSPTRQLIFFDHIKISPAQELSIIGELEKNKVNYVLMSNRVTADETGLGIFGTTYCPVLFKYLLSNFSPVFRHGGNWQEPPGSHTNHGVIVFKRNKPLV
jgi:hypothetical protein